MKRLMYALSVMLLAIFVTGGAHATPLSNLFNGGSITAGDKLFDNWKMMNYEALDPLRNFNAANIDVTALNDGGLNPGPGLKFSVTNNELSVTGDGIYAYIDLMFGFRTSVLDPTLKIKDNSLEYSSMGTSLAWDDDDSYDLGTYILEAIGTTAGLDDLGSKNIEFSELNKDPLTGSAISTMKVFDSAAFLPQNKIWVTKNIQVWSSDTTDTASLTGFEQRFSQTAAVPEPSTLFLLGGGLAGLIVLRKKLTGRAT